MFELLVSGDAVVPDHDLAIAQCQTEWALPAVHPNWTAAPVGAGAKWSFARLQRDRALAPTAFEVLGIPYHAPGADQRPPGYAYLPEIASSQGERPIRNHSTVVSVQDLAAVVARLTASGGKFRLDEPDATLPFPRLWIGFSDEHPHRYDPSTDGGLRLEVLPHEPLNMPTPTPGIVGLALEPGAPVRVVARTMVVSDLDATLGALDTHLGWQPEMVVNGDDGVRRARFSFAYPRSARLEVAQPDASSAEGAFLGDWGPGPFSIRIAVTGLEELRRRFVAGDVPHRMLPPASDDEGPRMLRLPERALGTALEFIDNE